MTIQGITLGFADPSDTTQNVVIVGRGDRYIKLINGAPQAERFADLDAAHASLKASMRGQGRDRWVEVRGLETSSIGTSRVTELGELTFATMCPEESHTTRPLSPVNLAKTAMKAQIAKRRGPRP